jgi:hypothetical protein
MSTPSSQWIADRNGYFKLDNGPLELSITDQSYRGCGWVWHVSVNGINGGDTIDQRGGHATADEAKIACEEWVRAFCRDALAAFVPLPTRGGPTEQFPDAPYCKPDQSCCDFCCGN